MDAEGPHCEDGRVRYASKTYENLEATRKAGLVSHKATGVKPAAVARVKRQRNGRQPVSPCRAALAASTSRNPLHVPSTK